MCREITCRRCKRPSWAGCGAHVERVLAHVPVAERCQCKVQPSPGGRLVNAVRSLLGRR